MTIQPLAAAHRERATSSLPYPKEAPPPPRYVMVPGLENSGPDHWQSRWEASLTHCSRIALHDWHASTRRQWIDAVDDAVAGAAEPIVLVGHSLGCLAIAGWAAGAAAPARGRIVAALLVAPPDVAQQGADLRLVRFGPAPATPLPFAALVVASTDDRYCSLPRAQALADGWRAGCVDIGSRGHINAESGLGEWHLGRSLLADLVHRGRGGDRHG